MSRGVRGLRIARAMVFRASTTAQRMKILGQRWAGWESLARKVQLERMHPHAWLQAWSMRTAAAFLLSYVLVLTLGAMVIPNGPRRPKPTQGPAPVTQTLDVVPEPPSLRAPRPTTVSKPDAARRPAEPQAVPRQPRPAESTAPLPRGEEAAATVFVAPRPAPAARPSAGVPGPVPSVTEITLWGAPSRPWVSITATGPVRYRLRNVEPDWVVVDLSRAQLALASGRPPTGRGLVRVVRAGQFAPDTVRVVLELTETVSFHVATSPDKTAIIVSLGAFGRGGLLIEPRRHVIVRPQPFATTGLVGSQIP